MLDALTKETNTALLLTIEIGGTVCFDNQEEGSLVCFNI